MISEQAIQAAATDLGTDTATIKAVMEVESKGSGFMPDGKVKILFEPHIFWKELKKVGIDPKQHTAGNQDILYPVWKTMNYGKNSEQWNRLTRAILIHREAALKSASWGTFQIMGFNWKACSVSIDDFVEKMKQEDNHLQMFVDYIQDVSLDDELQAKDWAGFARGYNGPLYTKNNYDKKLAAAYKKYSAHI